MKFEDKGGDGEPPKAEEEPKPAKIDFKKILVTLLKAAPDGLKVAQSVITPLREYMAQVGYGDKNGTPNDFHIYGLVRKVSGDIHKNFASLTNKQVKALVNYCVYLEDQGEAGKEFAQTVLTSAWAKNLSWKEACDLMAAQPNDTPPEGYGNVNALVSSINDKMTMDDFKPVMVGFGWPDPLPVKETVQFLTQVKDKGWKLFDDNATMFAQAMATGMQWTK
jgi:HPt (histidine-containing phosphotransfer) domain-containing protein